MQHSGVASRWAEAALRIAAKTGKEQAWEQWLTQVATWYRESRPLRDFLRHPAIPASAKKEEMRRLLEQLHASTLFQNMICLLIDRHRIELIEAIAEAYSERYDEQRGIVHAEVRCAYPLSDAQRSRLIDLLSQRLHATVRLRVQTDPSLIGGFRVQVGSRVWDASLANALRRLNEQLRRSSIAS
ncbi:MAG: ATP synthase F1 subunit delta [Firmicutes bacterium]|nr:ATP synthase F1 subunit delta [Bacillota bacterium]